MKIDIIEKLKKSRLFKNFIVLLSGEGIVSLLTILNLAIVTNVLGLNNNGKIIAVQTYCILFSTIFAFNSFQALIKFISESIQKNDRVAIKQYIKQSLTLDISAACVATIFGYLLIDVACGWFNLSLELKPFIKIYLITILFNIQGTPIGVLRVFNKFNLITYANVSVNIIKTILYIIGYIYKLNFVYFFSCEFVLALLTNIILLVFAYLTLKAKGLHTFYKEKTKIEKDFFMFNFYSNITTTIDIPVGSLTTMILNKYLGFSEMAIYKVFEKLANMISKVANPLGQIIYPEMSEMIAKKKFKEAKKLSDRIFYTIFGAGIVLMLFILLTYKWWLGIFIKDYSSYIIPLLIYMCYAVFANATTGTHSLFTSLNFIKFNIPILLIVNSLYLGLLLVAIKRFGLIGVILSLVLQGVSVICTKIIIMKKHKYLEYKKV